jgi:hypothetical protein
VSCERGHQIVAIEPVVEPVVVALPLRTVAVEIPHVAVAVRVAEMYTSPSISLPLEYS